MKLRRTVWFLVVALAVILTGMERREGDGLLFAYVGPGAGFA